MDYNVLELDGKTKITFNDNQEKFRLMMFLWLIAIGILFLISVFYFWNYLIFISIFYFIIALFGLFVIYFYTFKILKTKIIVIDEITKEIVINNNITHKFDSNTKIIQFYKIINGQYVYGNLAFEVNGKRDMDTFGEGELNYIIGKKINSLIFHITLNYEQIFPEIQLILIFS